MSDQKRSPQAVGIANLLASLDPQKGDLSYRMEGVLQAVSIAASLFTKDDRKYIADSILRACESFGQFDQKSGESTNRYALQTLQKLAA